MGIFQSMGGTLRLEITCADPTRLIKKLNESLIPLYDVSCVDALTIRGTLARADYKSAKRMIEKYGGKATLLQRSGLYWHMRSLLGRPVLLLGFAMILVLTLYLPSRILFVQVEGNERIPTRLILEAADSCGICFGASRSDVRSEKLKNKLISEIPQLQWAGINTRGCVATITVRERRIPDHQEENQGVSSIIASRDGVIQEITVTKGNALCQVGQAVKAGQTLVSGYTDCGIAIKVSQAEAEIYAQTRRSVNVVALRESVQKTQIIDRKKVYYLIVGNKIHPLFGETEPKASEGFFWQKTQQVTTLTLPGGFTLPVSLLVCEYACYETSFSAAVTKQRSLLQFAENYILTQMVSGRVVSAVHFTPEDGPDNMLQAEFSCIEMIGKVQQEIPVKLPQALP